MNSLRQLPVCNLSASRVDDGYFYFAAILRTVGVEIVKRKRLDTEYTFTIVGDRQLVLTL
jgi:hypothetical protein